MRRVGSQRLPFAALLALASACSGGGGGAPGELAGCPPAYAVCTEIIDLTGVDGPIQILPEPTFVYTPACIRVTTAQMVTIGASAVHPLKAGTCSPSDFVGGPVTTTREYAFTEPGRYGFYCQSHGGDTGAGMSGSIEVVAP